MYHHDPDYDTQAVRDLVWALSSPSLMDHPLAIDERWGQLEVSRNLGLLSRLDARDSALTKAIKARQSARLGEYFEILVTTWLDQIPPSTLLASNRQVFRGSHTVGEFDLIFRRDRAVHHWELAVKFYLGHPGRNGEPLWFGPNPRDRLDKKWQKMLSHQLELGQMAAGRASLEQVGIDTDVEPAAFIKGYLFEPLDDQFSVAAPEHVSPYALHGWWVHRPDLAAFKDTLDPDGERRWMTLSRLRWMSPARISKRDRARDFDTFSTTLPTNRAYMVAGLEQTDDGWREATRGFVLPDGWPR